MSRLSQLLDRWLNDIAAVNSARPVEHTVQLPEAASVPDDAAVTFDESELLDNVMGDRELARGILQETGAPRLAFEDLTEFLGLTTNQHEASS